MTGWTKGDTEDLRELRKQDKEQAKREDEERIQKELEAIEKKHGIKFASLDVFRAFVQGFEACALQEDDLGLTGKQRFRG